MRWIAITAMLFVSGCRSVGSCQHHHQTNKPIEVGVGITYNLPGGQGQVNMEVRR